MFSSQHQLPHYCTSNLTSNPHIYSPPFPTPHPKRILLSLLLQSTASSRRGKASISLLMGDYSSSSSSASASYIHMVHRLIEECILFNMNREECMDALSKHASIQPLITSTVWKELEKENQGFFEAYAKQRAETHDRRVSEVNRQRIREMLSDPTKLQL